jgi:hypothetical protein
VDIAGSSRQARRLIACHTAPAGHGPQPAPQCWSR